MRKAPQVEAIEQWCEDHKKQVSPVVIFHSVQQVFGLWNGELSSGRKNPEYAEARRCFTWFMVKLKAGTLKDIAAWMDIGDHTTIIHQRDRKTDLLSIGDEIATNNLTNVFKNLKQLHSNERV